MCLCVKQVDYSGSGYDISAKISNERAVRMTAFGALI